MTTDEDSLLGRLGSEDPCERYRAIVILAGRGTWRAIEPLIKVLTHDQGVYIEPVDPSNDYSMAIGETRHPLKPAALWALRNIYARRGPYTELIDNFLTSLAPEIAAQRPLHEFTPAAVLRFHYSQPETRREAYIEAIRRGQALPNDARHQLPPAPGGDRGTVDLNIWLELVGRAAERGLYAPGARILLELSILKRGYWNMPQLLPAFLRHLRYVTLPEARGKRVDWLLEDVDALRTQLQYLLSTNLWDTHEDARIVLAQLDAIRPRFENPQGLEAK